MVLPFSRGHDLLSGMNMSLLCSLLFLNNHEINSVKKKIQLFTKYGIANT